jgi:hypothetical protein
VRLPFVARDLLLPRRQLQPSPGGYCQAVRTEVTPSVVGSVGSLPGASWLDKADVPRYMGTNFGVLFSAYGLFVLVGLVVIPRVEPAFESVTLVLGSVALFSSLSATLLRSLAKV